MNYIKFNLFRKGKHEIQESVLRQAAISALAIKSKSNATQAAKEFRAALDALSQSHASDTPESNLARLEKGVYHLAKGLSYQGKQIADGVSLDAASQLVRDRMLKDIYKRALKGQ